MRTWLYKIATNRCLNALRSSRRRAAREWDVPDVEPPEPTRLGEVAWLQPYPDGIRHATGLFVLNLAGNQVCAIVRFESSVLPWFGLPRSLPSR